MFDVVLRLACEFMTVDAFVFVLTRKAPCLVSEMLCDFILNCQQQSS